MICARCAQFCTVRAFTTFVYILHKLFRCCCCCCLPAQKNPLLCWLCVHCTYFWLCMIVCSSVCVRVRLHWVVSIRTSALVLTHTHHYDFTPSLSLSHSFSRFDDVATLIPSQKAHSYTHCCQYTSQAIKLFILVVSVKWVTLFLW